MVVGKLGEKLHDEGLMKLWGDKGARMWRKCGECGWFVCEMRWPLKVTEDDGEAYVDGVLMAKRRGWCVVRRG